MTELCLAQPSDLAAMALITTQAWAARRGMPIPEEAIPDQAAEVRDKYERPGSWAAVAVTPDDIIAGFVLGYPLLDANGTAVPGWEHLSLLMVAPAYWGQGIGRRLLDWSTQHCRDRGSQWIGLWTQEDNVRARTLYLHTGYDLTGESRLHHGEPQVRYQLAL